MGRLKAKVAQSCLECGRDLDERVPGARCPGCLIERLSKSLKRHGKTCHTCAHFRPSRTDGGAGECWCTHRQKRVVDSCRKWASRIAAIRELLTDTDRKRWGVLLAKARRA